MTSVALKIKLLSQPIMILTALAEILWREPSHHHVLHKNSIFRGEGKDDDGEKVPKPL